MPHTVCLVPGGPLGSTVVEAACRIDPAPTLWALPGSGPSRGAPLPTQELPFEAPAHLAVGSVVLDALRAEMGVACVVAPVAGAPAYLALLARRQGLALEGVRFQLVGGGTVADVLAEARMFLPGPEAAELDFAELASRQMADQVVSPEGVLTSPLTERQGQAEVCAEQVTPERIGVCLLHHNRPEQLERAVASYEAQTLQGFSLVVVDNGSQPWAVAALERLRPRLDGHGWQILRLSDTPVGDARNAGAQALTADWLLFVDDDDLAKPHELEVLAGVAARTGADVVTCGMDCFSDFDDERQPVPRARAVFSGPCLLAGIFHNCFGPNNALWRADALRKVGGYRPVHEHGDWELFARAVLAGVHLEAVPEALFWCHVRPDHHMSPDFLWAAFNNDLGAFAPGMPRGLERLPELAFGQWARARGLDGLLRPQPVTGPQAVDRSA